MCEMCNLPIKTLASFSKECVYLHLFFTNNLNFKVMTLAQFKQQHGIQTIDLKQGTGRKFGRFVSAQTKQMETVFVSSQCDLTKPLFVNVGVHDAYWIGNKEAAKDVATI